MEPFVVLEQKVASLIEIIKTLKERNTQLLEENSQLQEKILSLEGSHTQQSHELEEEKAMTQFVVDELVKNIDSVLEAEK